MDIKYEDRVTKLKEELEEAICKAEDLKATLNEEKRLADIYNEGVRVGTDLMMFKRGLVDAGLTEKEAFSLIRGVL